NFGAGDSRPLRQVYQVRLGVESRAVAGCAEATVEHRGDRTLALGARDMHGANSPMRIADQFECGVHALELVDLSARLQRIQPVDGSGEPVHFQPGVYRLSPDGESFRPQSPFRVIPSEAEGPRIRVLLLNSLARLSEELN